MKLKIVFFFLFLSVNFIVFAQKKNKQQTYEQPKFTISDKTKQITYSEVIELNGTPDELYNKGLSWYKTYFKNPANVIRTQDKTNHKILGKARFKILNPQNKKGLKTMAGIVQYTIKIAFKDGKYRYVIDDINLKQTSKYPIERWLADKGPYYSPKNNFYLQQVDEYMKKTIDNLKKYMAKPKVTNNEDDW